MIDQFLSCLSLYLSIYLYLYLYLYFSLVSRGKGFRVLNRDVVEAGAVREFEKWIRECGCAREARARSGSGGI